MRKTAAIAVALLALSPCLAHGQLVYVQAESFTDSHNIMPESIHEYNDIVLVGLDYPEEWAEFQVVVPAFGTYVLWMRCWGTQNVPYLFHFVTRPVHGEEPQTRTLSFVGKGSCGS